MSFFRQAVDRFRSGDALTKLISINVIVWLLLTLAGIVLTLFNRPYAVLWSWLAIPSDLMLFVHRGWTLFTYMFLHQGFFHLFFNMLCLYWFGKILMMQISTKQLAGLYITGGILGGLFYLAAYNIFPYYIAMRSTAMLLGASASVMAIIVTSAMLMPDMQLRLLLIGNVKLKYIAMITVLVSLLGITSGNAGGELAHLGGALAGYLFVVFLRHGRDLTRWFTWIMDAAATIARPRAKGKQPKFHYHAPMNDGDYNRHKAERNAKVDAILDKIKRSGYDSLTEDEKKTLFRQ